MFIVIIIIIIMGQKPMQLLEPLLATGQESQCKEREKLNAKQHTCRNCYVKNSSIWRNHLERFKRLILILYWLTDLNLAIACMYTYMVLCKQK